MGEMGVLFREMTRQRKQGRAANKVKSTELLTDHGITFQSNNDGLHLVIQHETGTYDFWPSTEKWFHREPRQYSRGINELFKAIKIEVRNKDG